MNDTPARLINVATSLFALRGFDGTSVRDVTAAAEANLGAITYHFGSKQGLYEAVLEAAFTPVSQRLAAPRSAQHSLRGLDRVLAIMRLLFEHIAAHPHLQLLILRQIVRAQTLEGPVHRALGTILTETTAAIMEGQSDGTIRRGDPVLLAVSVMSQPAYFGLFRRLLPERLSDGRDHGLTTEELTEHAVAFVKAGLAASGEER